jgi:endothelin-converting enzyme/putative endopeptidase
LHYWNRTKKIDAVKLQRFTSLVNRDGTIRNFFGANVGPDAKNSNRNVLSVGPGGVGLPDRDYYVSDDADSKEKKDVVHM